MPISTLWPTLLILAAGCSSGKGSLDDDDDGMDIGDADDVADLCEEQTPETTTITVSFPATDPPCDFGEDGNLPAEQATVTARIEQQVLLELPEEAVICDVVFDFAGINGGEGTPMVYDDNFFFMFSSVVLAGSNGPLVESLPIDSDLYYTYDWDSLAGQVFEFDNDIPTYCLGEDDGLASCDIPPPETNGIMSLDFDQSIANELAFRAIDNDDYSFTFVTIGDDDNSDCYHEDFEFEVEIPYIEL